MKWMTWTTTLAAAVVAAPMAAPASAQQGTEDPGADAYLYRMRIIPLEIEQQGQQEYSPDQQRQQQMTQRDYQRQQRMMRGHGQMQPGQRMQQQRFQRYGQQQQQRQQAQVSVGQVTGEVVSTKKVDVRGTDSQHLVVLMRTRNNQRLVADLGPVQDVQNLNLQQGDRIQVHGAIGRIGDRTVLFADALRNQEGQVARIDRQQIRARHLQAFQQQGQQRGQQQRMTQGRSIQLQGQVLTTKRVQNRGTDQEHMVALVQTQDNRRIVVDLGPADQLQDVNISEGQQIQAQGNLTRIGDRQVLMAHSLRAGNQNLQISRREAQQQQQMTRRQLEQRERQQTELERQRQQQEQKYQQKSQKHQEKSYQQ